MTPGCLFTYYPFCLGFFFQKKLLPVLCTISTFRTKETILSLNYYEHTVNGICLVAVGTYQIIILSSENNCMSGFACLVVGWNFFSLLHSTEMSCKCISKTTFKMDICSIKSSLTRANRRTKKSNISLLSVENSNWNNMLHLQYRHRLYNKVNAPWKRDKAG